jgi:hypothetical protein
MDASRSIITIKTIGPIALIKVLGFYFEMHRRHTRFNELLLNAFAVQRCEIEPQLNRN